MAQDIKRGSRASGRPAKTHVVARAHGEPKMEFVTVSTVISGLSLAYTVGKDLIPKLTSKSPPYLITVDRSNSKENEKEVGFTISNLTLHGLYLEEICLFKPEKTEFTLRTVQMGWQDNSLPSNDSRLHPGILIEGQKNYSPIISFHYDANDKTRALLEPYGKCKFSFSLLHEICPYIEAHVDFRIR